MLKYYCEPCNYNATSKMDQNRHNRTKSHKDKINENISVPKLFIDDENNDADSNSSEKDTMIELLEKENEQLKEQIESLKELFKSFSDSPIVDIVLHVANDYYDAPNINQLTSFDDICQTITSTPSDEASSSMPPSFQDEPLEDKDLSHPHSVPEKDEQYLVVPPVQNKSKKKSSVIKKKEINNKKQENGYYDDMSDSEREFLNDLRELKEEERIRMKKPGYVSLFIDS